MTTAHQGPDTRSRILAILNPDQHRLNERFLSTRTLNALVATYFIVFSVSVLILYNYEVRPILYYALVATAAAVIFLEIVLSAATRWQAVTILFQTAFLSLNVIWGVTLKYYYFFGRTDVFPHVQLTQSVIDGGHIAPGIFQEYTGFPAWHILSSYLSLISSGALPVYKVMFIISGIASCAILVSMYALALKAFKDQRVALLTSLITSFFTAYILYGLYSIPRSIEPLFEIFLFILLFYRMDSQKWVLVLLVTQMIISLHTVSVVFIFAILLGLYLARRFFLDKKEQADGSFLSARFLAVVLAMVAVYWYGPGRIVLDAVLANVVATPPTGLQTTSIATVPMNELFNYLQYSLLLFALLVGFVVASNSLKYPAMAKVFGLAALGLVAVSFPGPALLINKLSALFYLDRFEEYAYPVLALITAVGVVALFRNTRKYVRAGICIFFVALLLFAVSNDFVASDNPLVKREFFTYYLTNGEVAAFDHVPVITNGTVLSDYVTTKYFFCSSYKSKADILQVDGSGTQFFRNTSGDLLLIRTGELNGRPLRLFNQTSGAYKAKPSWQSLNYYYSSSPLWRSLDAYNKVYDVGTVSGFN